MFKGCLQFRSLGVLEDTLSVLILCGCREPECPTVAFISLLKSFTGPLSRAEPSVPELQWRAKGQVSQTLKGLMGPNGCDAKRQAVSRFPLLLAWLPLLDNVDCAAPHF